jgi:hypothetical protein
MRRVAATLSGALLLVAAGCGDTAGGTVCPAIGYSDGLTVRLADGWPPGAGRSVTVTCDEPCGPGDLGGGPRARSVSASVLGSEATLTISGQPASVIVTVVENGAVVARADADLDWRRVGGSAECGGPEAATATVPAP